MRLPLLLLGASLAANAALYFQRASSPSPAPATPPPPAAPSPAAQPAVAEIFSQLKSGDPAILEKLRALNLPEPLRIALIRAQIDRDFYPRYRALNAPPKNYWEAPSSRLFSNASQKESLALDQEKEALLKKLLGDAYQATFPAHPFDASLSFLSPEKAALVRKINDDYRAISSDATTSGLSFAPSLPQDDATRDLLTKEKRADLEALLTPEELRAYDLRNSPTASRLRSELDAFEPTEAEFATLFDLAQAIEKKIGINPHTESTANDFLAREARRKAEDASAAEAKALLGDTRFDDLVRARNRDYQALHQIGQRYNLPKQTLVAGHELNLSYEKRARELPRDPQQRIAASQALTQEAAEKFTQLLGANAARAFQENADTFRRLQSSSLPATNRTTSPTVIIR